MAIVVKPSRSQTAQAQKSGNNKPQMLPHLFGEKDEFEDPSLWVAVTTYLAYATLIVFGHLRDFSRNWGIEVTHVAKEKGNKVCYAWCVVGTGFGCHFEGYSLLVQRSCNLTEVTLRADWSMS
ncbi:hypothetical protein SARC_01004 [Sphaeroforma arctica JP610]|uniref:Uncharacterized protein n=1 Tax=Sphaeroforma arctica JP610 TaxID=667725 RepID=A0A0L0GEY0_9EUKA|nr:hypothetical protein SARC_01004 [Sphaeroforma arctica JP610]KNC86858.1 hypothetical protein SARC_01004 [Sphaeroforma arctica JP610]|eukprot:XP_014160760.1 hypothetical protein SARC_01004 [Sphaeroforma arctica JP610]